MNVAFCINRSGLIGLGVSVSSLLQNCSHPQSLKLSFLCAGLTAGDKRKILRLLEFEKYSGETAFFDFDPIKEFGEFASLHGDWTNYGRLLLPDLVEGDQVLYLDADLVVEVDVLEIENFDFGGKVLAAVGGGIFRNTLGNKFYEGKLGINPALAYFNDGVLLINIKEWKAYGVKEWCLEFAKKFPLELPSHEQSLLNIFCAGNFALLPTSFNCSWIAGDARPEVAEKMIIHFIGAPKPWDPLSSLLHNGHKTWKRYKNRKTNLNPGTFQIKELKRLWNLRRSYARCIIKRFKARYANVQPANA